MIPSIQVCFRLMEDYKMLEHIKAHSVVVAAVARAIAADLKGAGMPLSIRKATAGALMHDIGKTASLESGEDHAELGRRICVANELYEISDIVAEHVVLKNYSPEGALTEKEVVYYADKRVNHDRIVDLKERLAYILTRYGGSREPLCLRIRKNFEVCRQVEKKLFERLGFTPDALPRVVERTTAPIASEDE